MLLDGAQTASKALPVIIVLLSLDGPTGSLRAPGS